MRPLRMLFNLSFRYKAPLWGSLLIVCTAAIMAGTLLFRAYDDLKSDLLRNAESQGRTLANSLFPAILHDQVWRSYEILKSPLSGAKAAARGQLQSLLILDGQQRIYAATTPDALPMLADFAKLSPEFAGVAKGIAGPDNDTRVFEPGGSAHLFVATPIGDGEARVGTLVQIYSKNGLRTRFLDSALHAVLATGIVLAVLLPLAWYWGQRTAIPLIRLTERMEELGRHLPDSISPELYDYEDELGRLFLAYNRTLQQMREKASIEREMVHSERLAAIGRLAAGVAHEINNPLLGMLTALNTLRRHGEPDARTAKTLSLLERGLAQIKQTVAALLVEARAKSRDIAPGDIDDLRTLISPRARDKSVAVAWSVELTGPVPVPATHARQVLINLLLNAVQASDEGGEVAVSIAASASALCIEVRNGGKVLSEAQKKCLFEPFVNAGESGHGLGLWVCYQIVSQLGGSIAVESNANDGPGLTQFSVRLPMEIARAAD